MTLCYCCTWVAAAGFPALVVGAQSIKLAKDHTSMILVCMYMHECSMKTNQIHIRPRATL